MKKAILLLIIVTLCVALCSCSFVNGIFADNTTTVAQTETTTVIQPQEIIYQSGQTATNGFAEVSLSTVLFKDEYLGCTPKAGYSFIIVSFYVKNVGKQAFNFYPGNSILIDYNNGYEFRVGNVHSIDNREFSFTMFTSTNNTSNATVNPLSDAVIYRAAICVPDIAVENTAAPLCAKIIVPDGNGNNTTIKYSIR